MSKAGCVNVVELEWWREDEVDFIDQSKVDDDEETKVTKVKFVFCPSQNHHTRSNDDDNSVLWGSWAILTPRYKLFYVGGTGYCEVFKSIGRKYGPFHMAALPIGGYEPEWKFGYANSTPEEAVKIHQDLLAMCSLAISWGTFSFSNEYYLDPPHKLQEELRKDGLSDMQFFLLKHGESRLIEIKEANEKREDHDHHHEHAEGHGDVHHHDHGNEEHHEHHHDDHAHDEEQDQGLIDYLVDKLADDEEHHD
eukprot:Seg1327.4 transcript_id=Seg1327.4/GoldUCD/mRNA.D3Y31 product="N-acyl-phosphatidylethanolamine-hydrolyzing phospholipase D" protein_id=Seg1327.4/GoldUCD/D3Y31